MLRRRIFVIGIISFAFGVAASVAEAANRRKFYDTRGTSLDCTGDPSGTYGSSLCRRVDSNVNGRVGNSGKPQNATTENKKAENVRNTTLDQDTDAEKRDDRTEIDEARGKKGKKRGYMKVFFMMAAAAKATLLYVMIHAVALVAGKALVVAKIALALAAAVVLKKALEHNDKTSVEIVKHPQHSYSQTHSTSVDYDHHGGYDGGHRRRRRRVR